MTKTNHFKTRLVQFFERVWNDGDLDAVDEFIGTTYRIRHDPGDPWDGRTLTPDEFRDRVHQSRAPFPDQRFTIEEMLQEERSICVVWSWAGTHLGDLPGFPASGRTVRISGITVYEFDAEGRIVGHRQVADRMGVYQQLSAEK